MQQLPPGFELDQQAARAPGIIRGPEPTTDPRVVERDNRSDFQDTRDTVSSLRGEFRKLPTYDRYIVALSAFNSSLTTQANPQGDQSLITSYAKMLDPTSAVREGEFATTSQTENTVNQIRARIAKELGLSEGGMLTPEGREFIRSEMYNLVQNRFRRDYERDRADFTSLAESYGYNPVAVVGSDPMTTYQEAIDGFLAQKEESQVKEPTAQDVAPAGYETGFDQVGRDDPFDRTAALAALDVTPEAEGRLVATLNANRGNANLTIGNLYQIYEEAGVPTPDDAGMQDLLGQLREGRAPTTGIDTSELRERYEAGLDARLNEAGEDATSNVNAAIFGATRGATFGLNDEATGLGAALAAGIQGEDPLAAYQVNRDLVRRQTDLTREESPVISIGSELAGGVLTGARLAGSPQTAKQAAKVGATEGGVYGFGTGDGLAGSGGNALLGAAGGAVISPLVQQATKRVSNALAARSASRQVNNAEDLAAASERTDVPLRRMDVDTTRQGERAALLQSDKTRDVIRDADAQDLQAFERAVANDLGDETNAFAAGQRIADGAIQSRERTRQQASRMYDRAHKQAGSARIEPRSAIEAVDRNIQELTEAGANQNAAAIRHLQGVKEDLAREGGLTVSALRSQRTGLRDSLKPSGLDRTDLERRMTEVLDAASEDIARGLRGNEQALGSFRQADGLWREQAQFKDRILTQLVGKGGDRSPEQTARAVQAFVKNDFNRASRLMNALDDTDKQEVRNLVASSLGRNGRGEFSIAQFLTATGQGGRSQIDSRTQRLIFGENGVKAIRDLRALAQAKETAASQTNRSNTGGVAQRAGRSLRTAMLGAFGFSEAGVTGGVVAPAAVSFISSLGEKRAARLLTNSDFTSWLRRTPTTSEPRTIDRHFEVLRRIAARTPGMTADVNVLERAFVAAVNDNSAGRIAAEQQPEEPNPPLRP